jgi:hypothetical protein
MENQMLQAEVLSPMTTKSASFASILPTKGHEDSSVVSPQLFELTYQAVEMDARDLWREKQDIVVAQLVEAVRLAELRGKQELYLCNITPWIKVGQADTGQVPIIQDKILDHLRLACEKLEREMPVTRLDLRQGEFGVRCYLGRMKPTDHVYEEDWLSDSR